MKHNIYIAFAKDGVAFGEFIKLWTLGKYAHCEIVVDGVSLSSTSKEGYVRAKNIDYDKNPDKWDVYQILGLKNDADERILKFFNRTEYMRYDYLGVILSHLIPFLHIHNSNEYFCSEWCAEALDLSTGGKLSHKGTPLMKYGYNKFNPNSLLKLIMENSDKLSIIRIDNKVWYDTNHPVQV